MCLLFSIVLVLISSMLTDLQVVVLLLLMDDTKVDGLRVSWSVKVEHLVHSKSWRSHLLLRRMYDGSHLNLLIFVWLYSLLMINLIMILAMVSLNVLL